MSKHNYVQINYKDYIDSKDDGILYIDLRNDSKKTRSLDGTSQERLLRSLRRVAVGAAAHRLTIYNDKIEKLILYHYNVNSIIDLSNFPNLKYVYMHGCHCDKLKGIDNLEELILSSCIIKKIQYTPTLKLFYQHTYQSGYESFITSYHQLKSNLSNTSHINWDKAYIEYINATDYRNIHISKI